VDLGREGEQEDHPQDAQSRFALPMQCIINLCSNSTRYTSIF